MRTDITMKVIILAAGQGTRLRPLTNDKPKCMVEARGIPLIDMHLRTLANYGVDTQDIYIVTGYKADILEKHVQDTGVNIIENKEFLETNMVCSLMCARNVLEDDEDVIVAYGDIVYSENVFRSLMASNNDISVVIDKEWYSYWQQRCDNPLDDAESLILSNQGTIVEIGQKTDSLNNIHAQYIGLMRFRGNGIRQLLKLYDKAVRLSQEGKALWRTTRNYQSMYMTDMLQGLADEGIRISGVSINRGWFEVDCKKDLQLLEDGLDDLKSK